MTISCPCCSGKKFKACCGRFLDSGQHARTAEQLMRSRFTAYALGGYGVYLMGTWLNSETLGLNPALLNVSDGDWYQLEIVRKSQKGDSAEVEFKAYYRDASGTEQVLHERSEFQRIAGQWYYVKGTLFN